MNKNRDLALNPLDANPAVRYDEGAIRVLKGLEPVRQRPGMYTRTDCPLHMVQEAIDNAADEALGGHASRIGVTLHADQSVTVDDDGRGIPVGLHPTEQVPVIELVFTQLHAGGKFDKKAGGAYAFSGGLHGVGVSVTNALSTRLQVSVWREGALHQIAFASGAVVEPLRSEPLPSGRGSKKTGTQVRIWPDGHFFDSPTLPVAELKALLRSKAVLLPRLEVRLTIEKLDGTQDTETWRFEDGLVGYLTQAMASRELYVDLFAGEGQALEDGVDASLAEGAQWVVAFTEEGSPIRESYVNLIPTPTGGTHEAGLRDGLFTALKGFVESHGLLPKGVKLVADDLFARASCVLSAKILDPQFQGQIKERLTSRDAVRMVSTLVRPAFEIWLSQNLERARKLAELTIRQAQARLRQAQKVEKRKGSGVAVLPGKLTDCEETDISRNEIFLVEGDSAGGSAKMGRDKQFQAILPLRGKVLNTWDAERDRLFANNEIHDIAVAIGVDPHSRTDTLDWSRLRYGKVCILSDADVDGSHIQVLLLTLFWRHFPQLVERGHVFVSRPPLFRVDVPAVSTRGGKKPMRKIYCLDDSELETTLDRLRKEGVKEGVWTISRFKGLGEMTAEQLWDTTLNPDTRRLMQVALGELGEGMTAERFQMLMGKGEAAARRAWLEENANEATADI